jgi:hypothetical protein
MALMKCSDCGNDCSIEAVSCPRCGKPIRAINQPRRLGGFTLFIIIVFAIVVGGVALIFFNHINTEADKLLKQANISAP